MTGEFQNILFGVEAAVNAVLGLLDPALGSFVGCTPNFPDETDPNSYGGAKAYLNQTSSLPGAPKKQACLAGSSNECITSSNTYAASDITPNRWEFKSVASATGNPKP